MSKKQNKQSTTLEIKDIEAGDLFYEKSHYVVLSKNDKSISFKHIQSNQVIELSNGYVLSLLDSADHYFSSIKIGKEDKVWTELQVNKEKETHQKANPTLSELEINETLQKFNIVTGGIKQKGLKSLWSEISISELFTVCFKKSDTKKTKAEREKYKLDLQKQLMSSTNYQSLISNKDLNTSVLGDLLNEIIDNSIKNPYTELKSGELRTLRGYKLQNTSDNGLYNCMDLDINESRPVNLNTIQWIIYKGIKYELE